MQRTSSYTSVHTHTNLQPGKGEMWDVSPGKAAGRTARGFGDRALAIQLHLLPAGQTRCPAGHRERSPMNHPGGDRRDPGPLPSHHSSQFAQFSFATMTPLPPVSGRVPTATLLGQTPAGCRRGLIPPGLFRAPKFPPNAGLTMKCHLGGAASLLPAGMVRAGSALPASPPSTKAKPRRSLRDVGGVFSPPTSWLCPLCPAIFFWQRQPTLWTVSGTTRPQSWWAACRRCCKTKCIERKQNAH